MLVLTGAEEVVDHHGQDAGVACVSGNFPAVLARDPTEDTAGKMFGARVRPCGAWTCHVTNHRCFPFYCFTIGREESTPNNKYLAFFGKWKPIE